jgi:hypothetical protein
VSFSIVLTAASPGGGTPSGSVRFVADGSVLGAPVSLAGGGASLTTASLTHGSHEIRVEYTGDANFTGTTNSLAVNQVVNTPPVGGTNNLVAAQNTAASIGTAVLVGSASDIDGDSLTVTGGSGISANGGTVVLSGSTVTYTPPTDYLGSDSFTCTVSDPFGGTTTVTVLVTVKSADVTLIGSVLRPSGSFKLTGSGVPNRAYVLQASTDLMNWADIQTGTADATGHIEFIDADAGNHPLRFYRTVAQ